MGMEMGAGIMRGIRSSLKLSKFDILPQKMKKKRTKNKQSKHKQLIVGFNEEEKCQLEQRIH